jgi:hypothetical protein
LLASDGDFSWPGAIEATNLSFLREPLLAILVDVRDSNAVRGGAFCGSGVELGSKLLSVDDDIPGNAVLGTLPIPSSSVFLSAAVVAALSCVCLNQAGSFVPRLAAI